MRVSRTATLVLASTLMWACGHGHDDPSSAHEAEAHEADGETRELRLNGSERWALDDHTRSMLSTMVERVQEWGGEDGSLEELGAALDGDLDALIKGCTMTGDAHAELHKFLTGLIPAIEELAAHGGQAPLRAVEDLLASYPSYFQ